MRTALAGLPAEAELQAKSRELSGGKRTVPTEAVPEGDLVGLAEARGREGSGRFFVWRDAWRRGLGARLQGGGLHTRLFSRSFLPFWFASRRPSRRGIAYRAGSGRDHPYAGYPRRRSRGLCNSRVGNGGVSPGVRAPGGVAFHGSGRTTERCGRVGVHGGSTAGRDVS